MNKPAPMSDDAIKMIVFGTRYEGVVETTRAIIAARDAMWEAMLAAPHEAKFEEKKTAFTKDARRYRWLRELPNADSLNIRFMGTDLDMVVDEAMKEARK